MAKIKGPLFSETARGSVDRVLTFSRRNTGQQARFQTFPADFESSGRKTQRDAFRLGIELWNYLPTAEKAYWQEIAQKGYANV